MDTLRGTFDTGVPADDSQDWDAASDGDSQTAHEAQSVRELPPEAIGQDERRMQVRAYNHWAGLLGEAAFPSIEDLEPDNIHDFGPNSVLLDFSAGIDDPIVQFLGNRLAQECGSDGPIRRLSDVPARSLLSRITDHYMQIIANQAPIGFEAEFINQRGSAVLYRGILLPFSSDHETIDFVYGVINWKEMADAATADELLLEIDQAIDAGDQEDHEAEAHRHPVDPVTEWADSPSHENEETGEFEILDPLDSDNVAQLGDHSAEGTQAAHSEDLPLPDFGHYGLDEPEFDEYGEEIEEEGPAGYSFASLADYIEAPNKKAVDLDADHFDPDDYWVEEPDQGTVPAEAVDTDQTVTLEMVADPGDQHIADQLPEDADLYDCLASARQLAHNAQASEDRSRQTLYAAVSRAYDVSLAAKAEPQAFEELIEESGLSVQDRAPMTPVVKLVFGHDYDKTRLTEYAAVLSHAHRLELERGSLAGFLREAEGGLKGVVGAERRLRREESGKDVEPEGDVRAALARKLRELDELLFDALSAVGPEFSLVMVRRDGNGGVALIGEIDDDVKLIERAGRKLVG